MHRSPILALLVLVPGVARATAIAPAVSVAAPASNLDAALDSIRPESIRADEFFIASDELGGRDTPSAGLKIAARFIRARLERLGWTPGAREGFFSRYPDQRDHVDESATKVAWARGAEQGELKYAQDYFLASTFDCRPLEASGPVVFCGDAGNVDFDRVQVQGKWALCFDDGAEVRRLRGPARQAGAIGVIVGPGPKYAGEPYAKRFERDTARQRRGVTPLVRGSGGDPEEDREKPYPLLLLGRDAIGSLLAAAGAPPEGPAVGSDLGLVLTDTRKLTGPVEVENVCGFWPGSDPALARETIVISAHYDHIGTRDGVVNNGADDNGSGTCGLLAVAEALTKYGPMRRSVMLLWLSGEEKGLWGSEAWTKDPWMPNDAKAICNINIDMIGRNEPDKLLITPTKARPEYNGLVRIAEKVAPLEGFPVLGSCDDYWSRSDHKNFADNLKIPVTFLFSDVHEDYHRPTDDPEKVDIDKIRRVSRMVVRMLVELQADELKL